MQPSLLAEREGAVLRLTLNRPDRLNSLDAPLLTALRQRLEEVEAGGAVRAVLLTGAGRAFCAGQDLEEDRVAPGPTTELGAVLEAGYNPVIHAIDRLPVPIVCAVNGVAAGAGASLALACDIVLAGRSARFIQAFARIGLVPDAGATWHLPRLLGTARAKALALLGEPLPAETAAAWGLIWQVVEDDALTARAEALASDLAAGPTYALGLIRQALAAAPTHSLDQQLDLECRLQSLAGRHPDYAEGVAAFRAKRPAKFSGA